MRRISLNCPKGVWPPSFTGVIALGVENASDGDKRVLWMLFEIKEGALIKTVGTLSAHKHKEVPDAIKDRSPSIVASANRKTWELVAKNLDEFVERVETGFVHIGGDYRVFGRYVPSLLRGIQVAKIWHHIDDVWAQMES